MVRGRYCFVAALLAMTIAWIPTFVGMTGEAQGATIYVSPYGTSTAPYDTYAKALDHPNDLNTVMSAGDIVYFAPARYDTVCLRPPRGGTSWTEYRCSSETVRSSTILSGAMTYSGSWTLYSGSVYRTSSPISDRWNAWLANYMTIERDSVLQQVQANIAAVNAADEYFYDGTTDLLYVYGNPTGEEVRYSQVPPVRFDYGDQDMILFFGLTFEMGYQTVINLSHANGQSDAPDSIWIIHCNIWKSSLGTAASNLSLVGSGAPGGGYPATLGEMGRFNKLIGDSLDHSWADDDTYSGGAGVDFYAQREYTIDSCWFGPNLRAGGIMFKYGGGGTTIHAANNLIRYNKIMGGRAGIWWGGKQDSLWIVGNEIHNSTYRGFDFHSTAANGPYWGWIHILNNTLYNCGSAASITISPTASNSTGICELKYNIIFDTTTQATRAIEFLNDASEAGPQTPSVETYWTEIDSNMYYLGAGTFAMRWSDNSGLTGTDSTAWKANGFDPDGRFDVNPNFANSGTPDLTPNNPMAMSRNHSGKTWTNWGAVQVATECVDPDPPTLVAPGNGASSLGYNVTFDWSDVPNAVQYLLSIAYDAGFNSFYGESPYSVVGQSDTTIALDIGTTYYWRLFVQDTCGYSGLSAERWFSTACTSLVAPNLAYPADNATGVQNVVTLYCHTVSGAATYEFKISPNADFSDPYYVQAAGSDTSVVLSFNLENGTEYFWEAIAYNACGGGTYSSIIDSVYSFTMAALADSIRWAYVVEDPSTRTTIGPDTAFGDLVTYGLGYGITYLDIDNVNAFTSAYYDTAYDGYILGGLGTTPSPTANADSICKSSRPVVALHRDYWNEINLGAGASSSSDANAGWGGYVANLNPLQFITRVLMDSIQVWSKSGGATIIYGLLFPDSLNGYGIVPLIVDKDLVGDSSVVTLLVADSGATIVNTGDGQNVANNRRAYFGIPQYRSQSYDSCQVHTIFVRTVAWAAKDTINYWVKQRICASGRFEVLDSWAGLNEPNGANAVYSSSGNYFGYDYNFKVPWIQLDSTCLKRKFINEYASVSCSLATLRLRVDGFGVEYPASGDSNWSQTLAWLPSKRVTRIDNGPWTGSAPVASLTYPVTNYVWASISESDTVYWDSLGARSLETDVDTLYWSDTLTAARGVTQGSSASGGGTRFQWRLAAAWWDSVLTGLKPNAAQVGRVVTHNHDTGDNAPPGVEVMFGSSNAYPGMSYLPQLSWVLNASSQSSPQPAISVDLDTMFFSGTVGGSVGTMTNGGAPLNTVSNSAGGFLTCASVSDDAAWLAVSTPGGGDCPFITYHVINTAGLSAGVHYGTVTVTCAEASNSPQTYVVELTLEAVPAASSVGGKAVRR